LGLESKTEAMRGGEMSQNISEGGETRNGGAEVVYSGGIEGNLSGWAMFFLICSVILGVICFIAAGNAPKKYSSNSWGEDGFSGLWIGVGIGTVAQGIVLYLFLVALAEIIRLLKKQNGLSYSGKISEVYKQLPFDETVFSDEVKTKTEGS
jgi:hypothetical protein